MASKAVSQQWSVETDTSTPATSTLDLRTVLEDVHDGHSKWYGIGLQLGLKPTVLDGIQGSDTTEMLREMLKRWLKNVDPMPTWVALIKALRSKTVDEPTLAEQLEEKYQIVPPTPSSTSSLNLSCHDNSDITDHGKQLEDNLHSATKEIETLKADPSKEQVAESSEFTLERQRSLQSVSDRLTAMQTQLTKLMNHVSSLELDKEAQKESKVPVEDMIKELEYLKDENRHLRTHVTKLEEKVTLLTKEKEDQERSFVEEKMKKEKEIVQKAIELADKSEDYINLLNKMEQMKNERDEAQKQAEELRQQPKTQNLDEMQPPPETAEGNAETAAV